MPDRVEYLVSEVDRQLEETREQATALATRAGLVMAVAAVAGALVAENFDNVSVTEMAIVVVLLIIASITTISALAPTLTVGPTGRSIERWRGMTDARAVRELLDAKLVAVEANRRRLLIMTCAFYAESLAVAAAVITMIIAVAGK